PWQVDDIRKITEEFEVPLVWHDVSANTKFAAMRSSLRGSRRLGISIYARLLIHEFVGIDAQRAVYLDCDVMVRAPIEALWDIDMDNQPVAAVPDPSAWFFTGGRDLREKKEIFSASDAYFNSRVLLIDLKRWRSEEVWEKFCE